MRDRWRFQTFIGSSTSHNDASSQGTTYFVIKIQLTHKTVFLILLPRKSKFLLKNQDIPDCESLHNSVFSRPVSKI
jgi:hypothetical protein